MAILVAMMLAAAGPSPQAEALGRELAGAGMLAALLPTIVAKDTAEMIAAHPELSPTERETLTATGREVVAAGLARLFAAMGHEYATKLSVAELTAVLAFQRSAAGRAYKAAEPGVMAAATRALAGLDFKRDTLAAFCAKTEKACAKR